jgi:hypothetical protein
MRRRFPIRPLHRLVEIGVVEHDVRRFAAKLERHGLQPACGELVDLASRRVTAGETHVRDLRMRDEIGTDFGSEPGDDVDDAFGKSRFGE